HLACSLYIERGKIKNRKWVSEKRGLPKREIWLNMPFFTAYGMNVFSCLDRFLWETNLLNWIAFMERQARRGGTMTNPKWSEAELWGGVSPKSKLWRGGI
ncbi:MAG: hypothetical protein GX946_09810, partial [Oligosphaeraceae bacterium]|nr:hypothetical protein [Oligosphaeraceae bacterium]